MRCCGLGEGELGVDHDLQLTAGDAGDQPFDHLARPDRVGGELGTEEHTGDRCILLHQRPDHRRPFLATGAADPTDSTAIGERGDTPLQHVAADGIDDEVDAATISQAQDFRGDVGLRVVDPVIHPVLAKSFEPLVTGGGGDDDGRACGACQLDRGQSDSACARLDQDRFACPQFAEFEQAVISRTELDRDPCGLGDRHRVGDRIRRAGRDAGELGMTAVAHHGDHPLPDGEVGDPITDGDDGASGLIADDVRAGGEDTALTVQQIATLDADGTDFDDDTAGAHRRLGDFFVAEHVGSAGLVIHGCSHGGDCRFPRPVACGPALAGLAPVGLGYRGLMLPQELFGRTGHLSTRVLFGAASLGGMRQQKADEVLDIVLQSGINHIDTAASYGDSELRLQPFLADHRDEFFLATKTDARTGDAARAQLELSLQRLGVDHVDLIQLHNLVEPQEWEIAHAPDGAVAALVQAREEGLVKFIGVTGHGTRIPQMHLRSLERFDFDSVLLPYNYLMMQNEQYSADTEELLALCAERDVAVQTIKSAARRRWSEDSAEPHFSWYQALPAGDALTRGVNFVLGRPGLFLNTSSDARLLPAIIAAASGPLQVPTDIEMQSDVEANEMQPLFDGKELERI